MTNNQVDKIQWGHLVEKRDALRRRWQKGGGPDGEPWTESPPLSEEELRAIERDFGIILPAEYRAFLQAFGDTLVGPGVFNTARGGLTTASKLPFPLTKACLGVCSPRAQQLSPEEQGNDYHGLLEQWKTIPLDHGVLQISGYGCAIQGVLILNGPFCGEVWIQSGDAAYHGPFGGSECLHDETKTEWEPTDSPRAYSFFEWYENWLDAQSRARPAPE